MTIGLSTYDDTNEGSNTPDKGEGAKGGGEQVDAKDLNQGWRGDCAPEKRGNF